jgi:hypothetical protein
VFGGYTRLDPTLPRHAVTLPSNDHKPALTLDEGDRPVPERGPLAPLGNASEDPAEASRVDAGAVPVRTSIVALNALSIIIKSFLRPTESVRLTLVTRELLTRYSATPEYRRAVEAAFHFDRTFAPEADRLLNECVARSRSLMENAGGLTEQLDLLNAFGALLAQAQQRSADLPPEKIEELVKLLTVLAERRTGSFRLASNIVLAPDGWGLSRKRDALIGIFQSAIEATCSWAAHVGESWLSDGDYVSLINQFGAQERHAFSRGWGVEQMDPTPLLKLGFAQESKSLLDRCEKNLNSPDLISWKDIIQDLVELGSPLIHIKLMHDAISGMHEYGTVVERLENMRTKILEHACAQLQIHDPNPGKHPLSLRAVTPPTPGVTFSTSNDEPGELHSYPWNDEVQEYTHFGGEPHRHMFVFSRHGDDLDPVHIHFHTWVGSSQAEPVAGLRTRPLLGPLGDWDFSSIHLATLAKPGFENSTDEAPMGEVIHVLKKREPDQLKPDQQVQVSLIEIEILRSLDRHGPVMRPDLEGRIRELLIKHDPEIQRLAQNAMEADAISRALDRHLEGLTGTFTKLGVTLQERDDGNVFILEPSAAPLTIHLAESKHPG